MKKIGESILAEAKGGRGLEESNSWKLQSSEKSKLKRGFDQLQKDLSTVEFKDETMRGQVMSHVKSAEKGVSNPGWGRVLGDLDDAIDAEMDGRGLSRREGTVTWELYLVVMEALVDLTERLAREDGRWFVADALNDKLRDMKQRGFSQADLDDSYFRMEYPWTEKFDKVQMSRLFRAAHGGWNEGMGLASAGLQKTMKGLKQ